MQLKQKSHHKNITRSVNNLIKALNTKIANHNKELKSVCKNITSKNKLLAKNKYLHSASIIDLINKLHPFIISTKNLTKLLPEEKTTSLKRVHILQDIKKNIHSLLNISGELNYLNSLDKICSERINLYVFYHTIFTWLKPYYRNKKVKLKLQFFNKHIPLVLGNKNYLKTIIQEILNCAAVKNPKRTIVFKITPDEAKKTVITEIQNIDISTKQEPKSYIQNHLRTKTIINEESGPKLGVSSRRGKFIQMSPFIPDQKGEVFPPKADPPRRTMRLPDKKCKSENFWRLFKIKSLINNTNTKISYSCKNSNLIITLPIAD